MGTYSILKVYMCQHSDANSSSNWRYQKGLFLRIRLGVFRMKKTYILREIPKTRFIDSGLLYENDEEECVVLNDLRMADIGLALLVYLHCLR